jgi:hypothetical protein
MTIAEGLGCSRQLIGFVAPDNPKTANDWWRRCHC